MFRRGILFVAVALCVATTSAFVAAEADAKLQLKLSENGKDKGPAKDLSAVVEAIAHALKLETSSGSRYELEIGSQGEEALEEAVIEVLTGKKTDKKDKKPIVSLSSSGSDDSDADADEVEVTKEEVAKKHKKSKKAAKKHLKKQITKKAKKSTKKHSKKHDKGWVDSAASKIGHALHTVASKAGDVAETIEDNVAKAVNKTGKALEDAFGSESGEFDDDSVDDYSEEDDNTKKVNKKAAKAKKAAKKVTKVKTVSKTSKQDKKTKEHEKKTRKTKKGILDSIHHAWDHVHSKADDLVDELLGNDSGSSDSGSSDSGAGELKVKSINLAQKSKAANNEMGMQTIALIGSVVGALVGVVVIAMVALVNSRTHTPISPNGVEDAEEEAEETEETDEKQDEETDAKAQETEGMFEGTA